MDTPALLPDGTPSESSVSRLLTARGTIRSAPSLADDIVELQRAMRDGDAADASTSTTENTETTDGKDQA